MRTMTIGGIIGGVLTISGCTVFEGSAPPLTGDEARTALAGNTFATDGGSIQFLERGGALIDDSGEEELGSWRVVDNQTCVFRTETGETCYSLVPEDGGFALVDPEGDAEITLAAQ